MLEPDPPAPVPADLAAAHRADPGAFAQLARDCVDQIANICDAFAATRGDTRWHDVAIHLVRASLVLRELE